MRQRALAVSLVVLVALPQLAAARQAGAYRAAIDMGSSSVKLLIVDANGKTVVDAKIGAGLGRGLGPDRLLPKANRERATAALKTFVARAARYGIRPEEIDVVATAAVRDAKGRVTAALRAEEKMTGRAFVAELKRSLGLSRLRILTPRQEALLGHAGALAGFTGSGGPRERFVVIDTGGGSHQVVVGTRRSILAAGSKDRGTNFVAERILVDETSSMRDTVTPEQFAEADRRLATELPSAPIAAEKARGATPVMIGGIAKFMRLHFGRDVVTRADVEQLRLTVGSIPRAARAPTLAVDHRGRAMSRADQELFGMHTGSPTATSHGFGSMMPAKLTLVLRVMTLLDAQHLNLSETDARHALVGRSR